jgi:hypothetical protein
VQARSGGGGASEDGPYRSGEQAVGRERAKRVCLAKSTSVAHHFREQWGCVNRSILAEAKLWALGWLC